jgi:3-polyprenyl-4-hydroxybenzoate decarboxylase
LYRFGGKENMEKKQSTEGIKDLRSVLEWLRLMGCLLETDVEVSPDLEIIPVQKHTDGRLPFPFNNIKGYPHLRTVTNVFANTSLINEMFGWPNDTERMKAIA